MTRYIATKIHKALELAPEEEFFQRCSTVPHFVVDPSLVELLARGDVQASINAMIEAGIARLPYAEILIELETDPTRNFVLLEEYQDHFRANVGVLRKDSAAEVDPRPMELTLEETAIAVDGPSRMSHETWMRMAGFALAIALLMLNIQGVEKELIEPVKLNKQRRALGKPQIPAHSVMRIGHYYDSDGNRQGFGTGRQMPVHLRAGHARHQHYGEGNALVKIVYIPPVLVNFKPGDVVRQPKRVLAA